jgi:LysR family transcriptional regulator, glycine cleavage system transcriptional activator
LGSHLPPLQLLRGFEAAARHLSFTRAADELHLTHGAISHQIKALEGQLGTKLFHREGRKMVLTESGQILVLKIRQGLRLLEQAFEDASLRSNSGVLTISVLPAFAARWLVPRLASFQEQHSEIELNLRTTRELANLEKDGVDLAIRYGPGGWPGLQQEKLMEEIVFPVCSPTYRRGKLPKVPDELSRADLLRNPWQPWGPWFNAARLDLVEPRRGTSYTDAELLLEAAAEGLGIALARSTLVADDLHAGRLIRLFDVSVRDAYAYYLVWRSDSGKLNIIRQFRDWIFEQLSSGDIKELGQLQGTPGKKQRSPRA